jgi:hypothetical protein
MRSLKCLQAPTHLRCRRKPPRQVHILQCDCGEPSEAYGSCIWSPQRACGPRGRLAVWPKGACLPIRHCFLTPRQEYIVWNPPFIDKTNVTQGRVHTITEASRVFRFLMARGIRAIIFCKIRKICELLMKQVRQDLMTDGRSDMVNRVMSYRSGYNAEVRPRLLTCVTN